jgi:hypothetical protein
MARRPVAQDLIDEPGDDQDALDVRGQDNQEDISDDETDDEADEDEAEDDEIDASGEQSDEPPLRRQRGGDDLATRVEAAERKAAEAERRANEIEQRYQARENNPPTETAEQEAARLALMTPDQIVDYKVGKALGRFEQTQQRVMLQTVNASDKSEFAGLLRENPQWKKLGTEVEKRHAEFVKQGQYPTRETVLKYLLGEQAMTMSGQTRREAGDRRNRVQRQQVRAPSGNRSDVQPQRRGGGKTAEDRLDGVLL